MSDQSEHTASHTLVIFDGVCNLCSTCARIIIRNDKKDIFRLGTLQSDNGQNILREAGIADGSVHSLIVLNGARLATESDAILEIARKLPFPWKLFYVLRIFPKPLRDALYGFIAKHRYSLFGKKDVCMVPAEEIRGKFL